MVPRTRRTTDAMQGPWRVVSLVAAQTLLLVAGLALTGYLLLVLTSLVLGAGREVMAFFG